MSGFFDFMCIPVRDFASRVLLATIGLGLFVVFDGSVILPSFELSKMSLQKCQVGTWHKNEGTWIPLFSMENEIKTVGDLVKFFAAIAIDCQPMAKEQTEQKAQDIPRKWWDNQIKQMLFFLLLGVICGYFSNKRVV